MSAETFEIRDCLISLIYEAALQENLWPEVLRTLADFAGCPEASLVGFKKKDGADGVQFEHVFSYASGRLYSPDAHKAYREYYSKIDALSRRSVQRPSGELTLSQEIISEDEVKKDEYFQDFLVPNGVRHLAGWNLENDRTNLIALALHTGGDGFSRENLAACAGLAQHIRRSLSIATSLRRHFTQAQMLCDILEREGVLFLTVNADGKVLECSAGGAGILEAGRPLHLRIDGRVGAVTALKTTHLRELIRAASNGTGGGTLRVPGLDGHTCFLQIVPMGVKVQCLHEPKMSGCALILIRSLDQQKQANIQVIRAAFDCTQAEAEVGAALASGQKPKQIAEHRRVSLNTVRTQIRKLTVCADARRATELVSLINLLK